jgi:hypothetical protein
MIIRFVVTSYTALCPSLGLGGIPIGLSCVQAGVPNPFAPVNNQTSFPSLKQFPSFRSPPNMTMLLVPGSNTVVGAPRALGGPPAGFSWIHDAGECPSALLSTQTSLVQKPFPHPAKMVISSEMGSYTALERKRAAGGPPLGIRFTHVGTAVSGMTRAEKAPCA